MIHTAGDMYSAYKQVQSAGQLRQKWARRSAPPCWLCSQMRWLVRAFHWLCSGSCASKRASAAVSERILLTFSDFVQKRKSEYTAVRLLEPLSP
eukprot:5524763-Amphidinium_carterae.1